VRLASTGEGLREGLLQPRKRNASQISEEGRRHTIYRPTYWTVTRPAERDNGGLSLCYRIKISRKVDSTFRSDAIACDEPTARPSGRLGADGRTRRYRARRGLKVTVSTARLEDINDIFAGSP
jgi:hypothetical protein